jgi:hypothetical protein
MWWSQIEARSQLPSDMPEEYGKGTPIRHTVHTHHQPFLLMCNNSHKNYAVSVPSSVNRSLVTSAYVDITVFITRDGGSKHQGLWCTVRSNVKRADVNWTSHRPMEKLNALPVRISIERTRGEISRCLPRQQQNWTLLETKVRAMRTQWERVPQATSYQERNKYSTS